MAGWREGRGAAFDKECALTDGLAAGARVKVEGGCFAARVCRVDHEKSAPGYQLHGQTLKMSTQIDNVESSLQLRPFRSLPPPLPCKCDRKASQ